MAEVAFRPARQLSEYKGKGASASREGGSQRVWPRCDCCFAFAVPNSRSKRTLTTARNIVYKSERRGYTGRNTSR